MSHAFTTKIGPLKSAIGMGTLLALTPACTSRPSDAARSAALRPLEVLVPNDAETLDPRYVTDPVGMRVSRLVHAGLTRIDPTTLRPVPFVAEQLVWTGPLTLVVTLRDGVRFHSGAAVTSEDVISTLRAFADPGVGSRHTSSVEAIASAESTGERQVTITLRRPHATLLADLELPILRHDQASAAPDPSGATLDGLGPYRVEHTSRGEIALAPASGGAVPQPSHAVVVRTVHDDNARALRLEAGNADLAMNGVSPTLLPAIEALPGLTVASAPGANLTYVVMRQDRAPLSDVRLRRAISLAIDRSTIAETLLAGHATPAETVLPKGHWAATQALSPWPFDPGAARALVQAAMMTTSETRPHATLLTSTDRLRVTMARTISQELGDAGFDVEVVTLDLGTLIARLNAGDFDMASLQLPELVEPNVLRVFLHSAFVPPLGANRGRVRDAELDALLDDGERTTDEAERTRIYQKVDARIRDQLFIIPLWHEDQVAVRSTRARDFVPSPDGRWLSVARIP
jgi:peptide/nickel transport system substrate-binding protein